MLLPIRTGHSAGIRTSTKKPARSWDAAMTTENLLCMRGSVSTLPVSMICLKCAQLLILLI